MTTSSSATVLDHTSDAAFRAWGSEFSTKLAAVGMVQTGDTGQINWVTVTRPGASTAGGYEIWRFADSSIYIKFEYGTGTSANFPQMWSTAGTGSNGSGTITGQTDTRATFTINAAPVSLVTNYTSRWCHTTDAFSVSWKETASGAASNQALLVYGKAANGAGVVLNDGFARIRTVAAGGAASKQCVRTVATAATYTDLTSDWVVPGDPGVSSTATTGNQQAYQIPMNVPDVLPFAFACIVLLTEATRGSTVTVAMIGITNHTYISPGQFSGQTLNNYTAGRYTIAIIYE